MVREGLPEVRGEYEFLGGCRGGRHHRREEHPMKVGIIDILADSPPTGWRTGLYNFHYRRQLMGIMPQVISVWCRQLGHDVAYTTYYGQKDPLRLLPDELDVLFVSSYTQASGLAYALAKVFRQRGTLTVIGGAHARSFPTDCLRFFDLVVRDCNRELVEDILLGRYDPPAAITCGRPLADFPSVEERMPEIRIASFRNGRPLSISTVPMFSSIGCPYTCDFCVDWNSQYINRPAESLLSDLQFLSQHWPRLVIGYHDPNFAVRFDETMDVVERIPEGRRNPYVMESSLSILKPSRLSRLERTNCVFIAPGIESWVDYSNKSAVGNKRGRDKVEQVVDHLKTLARHIRGIQANMLFGGDADAGAEPVALTKEFISRVPEAWPTLNIPCPFGGTPLYDRLYREGRILHAMPFALYYNPYLVTVPKHYDAVSFYDHYIEICETAVSWSMLWRRLRVRTGSAIRGVNVARHFGLKADLTSRSHRIRAMLASNAALRVFHEGRSDELPEFYRGVLNERLGRYAELFSDGELRPVLEEPSGQSTVESGHS